MTLQPTSDWNRTAFPPVGELPYLLTLPGHGFYWFELTPRVAPHDEPSEFTPAALDAARDSLRAGSEAEDEASVRDRLHRRRSAREGRRGNP